MGSVVNKQTNLKEHYLLRMKHPINQKHKQGLITLRLLLGLKYSSITCNEMIIVFPLWQKVITSNYSYQKYEHVLWQKNERIMQSFLRTKDLSHFEKFIIFKLFTKQSHSWLQIYNCKRKNNILDTFVIFYFRKF